MSTALRSGKTDPTFSTENLQKLLDAWIIDCEYRQLSPRTIELRQHFTGKFLWWINQEGITDIDPQVMRRFFVYVGASHNSPNGRWGNPSLNSPVSSRTVKDIFGILRTFFRFLEEEGHIDASPMEKLRSPVHRADQIQPLTEEQITALIVAARKSRQPLRDEALILFMLDTGVRVSELCSIKTRDVDFISRKILVRGKGNKVRSVYFCGATGKLLRKYLSASPHESDFLFESRHKEAFTRYGVRQVLERAAEVAGIKDVRCSPHTIRHTFAVMFLRHGGSVFTLKELLGHADLTMTNKYVKLAQADIQNQHRQFSPVSQLTERNAPKRN